MLQRLTSAFAALRRLGCTPAEAAAVGVLAVAAVGMVSLFWFTTRDAHRLPPLDTGATPGPSEGVAASVSTVDVIVHVAGAVTSPGVYTLAGGSRVGDAVAAAGGPTPRAVLDGLNLARPLNDGEQILVPDRRSLKASAGGGTAAGGPAVAGGSATGEAATVNINQATAQELETLPGIGPVLAGRIVEHRDSVGGFREVGELRDVAGIGEKTFQALAPLVSL